MTGRGTPNCAEAGRARKDVSANAQATSLEGDGNILGDLSKRRANIKMLAG